ncbi:solute carrier organic anion transporter family member 4C1-like isoform X2 [Physella acuta]|uniref:solute carrier organic anion transporter family member 4C1-like isoform X2 n=1 Tax=Physella acuta TaxID=109671 RepID=UPI0027DE8AC0|nr:solute carrier organic anion transporter family member 4C1-like isoform X2 [Physella acuta]
MTVTTSADGLVNKNEQSETKEPELHIDAPPKEKSMPEEEENREGREARRSSEDSSNRCGYGRWRPQFLQTFNSPNCLVFFMGVYSLVLGFEVNGVQNVNVSSIERRYDLDSTNLGFVSSAYDVSAAMLAVVIGYIGSGRRKPRMLSITILFSAIGSFCMAVPHFTAGQYTLGMAPEKICVLGASTTANCTNVPHSSPLSNYLYVFLFSQLLHGIGGTTLFTVGISLMDDSVVPQKTPLFLGIIYGCNILGSGLGYIIGGQLLNIYVDFDTLDSIKLTPKDPRWLGAWWLGPTIAAVLQLVVYVPISLYGSELPGTQDIRQNRKPEAHAVASGLSSKFKNNKFMATTMTVLRNPCFVFVTLGMTTEAMFMSGSAAFLPKFIENQYGIPASRAAVFAGIAVVPAAVCGLVMGGFIAKKFNFTITQALKYMIVTGSLSVLSCAVVWIRCEHSSIYGVSIPYISGSTGNYPIKLDTTCNSLCNCDTDAFEPVCNKDTSLYFSPCYAGCIKQTGNDFHNCSCIDAINMRNDIGSQISKTLGSENCRKSCPLLFVFVILLFFAMCISFMPIAPCDAVQLRCVHEDHKVYAQGIKTLIVRMLGSFMGPVLMGKLLDLTCDTWREKCGQRLSCWLYDPDHLVTGVYVYSISLKGLSVIFSSLALKFYRPPPSTELVVAFNVTSPSPADGEQDETYQNDEAVIEENQVKPMLSEVVRQHSYSSV